MKKIQKNDLRLEKEVISALTETDLRSVKGGVEVLTNSCKCVPPPVSYYGTCVPATRYMVSCGGGCEMESVKIACEILTIQPNCGQKP